MGSFCTIDLNEKGHSVSSQFNSFSASVSAVGATGEEQKSVSLY